MGSTLDGPSSRETGVSIQCFLVLVLVSSIPLAEVERHEDLAGNNARDAHSNFDAASLVVHAHHVAVATTKIRRVRGVQLHPGVGFARLETRHPCRFGARVEMVDASSANTQNTQPEDHSEQPSSGYAAVSFEEGRGRDGREPYLRPVSSENGNSLEGVSGGGRYSATLKMARPRASTLAYSSRVRGVPVSRS